LIWPIYFEASETVARDRSAMTAVGRSVAILRALPGKEVFLAHESGNRISHLMRPSFGPTRRSGALFGAFSEAKFFWQARFACKAQLLVLR
jgi:hypothetical protein